MENNFSHEYKGTYAPLKEEMLSHVTRLARLVEHKSPNIKQEITNLNRLLSDEGLIAGNAQLHSDFALVYSRGINNGLLEPVFDPEILTTKLFKGVFIGCDVAQTGDGEELVYVIEMPLDEETMRFRTVIAPIATSRVLIKERAVVTMEEVPQEDLSQVSYFKELIAISDEELQQDVSDLMHMFSEYEAIDHAFVRELGRITTHMLTNPFVGINPDAQRAILGIIDTCFSHEGAYELSGEIFEMEKSEGGSKVNLTSVEVIATYSTVALVNDYTVVGKYEDIVVHESYQPVILFPDNKGKLLQMPLKSIRSIDRMVAVPAPTDCMTFRDRYLNGYYTDDSLA